MAKFATDLVVKALDDKTWRLTEDLVYQSDILGVIVVPAYYITDFSSVPRLPFAYLLAGDTAHEAAVVHDYLYQAQPCTKSQADRVFREAMGVTGIVAWRKNLMYTAVSLGGWFTWNKYKKILQQKKLNT